MGCGSSVPKKDKADGSSDEDQSGTSKPEPDLNVTKAPAPPPAPVEDPNTPPKVLSTITDSDGLLLQADLQLGLKVLGLVKGPLEKSMRCVMVKPNGKVSLEDWWFELRLEPRNRVIINAKAKQPRPEGWKLSDAMQVAKAFDSATAEEADKASIGRVELKAALNDFGISGKDLQACMSGVNGDSIVIKDWLDNMHPDTLELIFEELEGIVDVGKVRESVGSFTRAGPDQGDDPLANAKGVEL